MLMEQNQNDEQCTNSTNERMAAEPAGKSKPFLEMSIITVRYSYE